MPGEDAHSSGCSIPALRPASFKTRRLFVRSLCADDLEEFSRNRARPEVAQYQSWGVEYTLQDAQRLLDAQLLTAYGRGGSWHQLAIVRCEDGQLLGDLAVHFCDFGQSLDHLDLVTSASSALALGAQGGAELL